MKFNLKKISFSIVLYALGSSASPTTFNDNHELFEKRNDFSYHEPHNNFFEPITHLPFTKEPVSRHYNLILSKKKLSPDGFERVAFVGNGQYPGPIILANKGDRIVVKVINKLGVGSTIHWHGMRQYLTPWFDGAANGIVS